MPKQALIFTPSDVSETAKKYLEQRFMQEDYKSYWCDIEAILEEIGENSSIFPPTVFLPKTFNWNKKKFTLADIPVQWWKVMKFPAKIERQMKAFWKQHPEGRIEWKW